MSFYKIERDGVVLFEIDDTGETIKAGVVLGFAGHFDQATEPSVEQIPSARWGFWYDTSRSIQLMVCRRGTDLHCVEMS